MAIKKTKSARFKVHKKNEQKRREINEENQLLTNLLKSQARQEKKDNPFNTIVNS